MALDPRIILGGTSFEVPDPLVSRINRSRARLFESQAAENEQQVADEQALRGALGSGPINEQVVQRVMAVNPRAGAQLQQILASQAKTEREASEAKYKEELVRLKTAADRAGMSAQIFSGITNDAQKMLAYPHLKGIGFFETPEAEQLYLTTPVGSQQWNDGRNLVLSSAVDQKTALEMEIKRNEEARDAAMHKPSLAKAETDAAIAEQKRTGAEPIQPAEQARIDAAKITADLQREQFEETKRHHRATEVNAVNDLTADQKNYERAKREGFDGDFLQWMRERNPRSVTEKERNNLGFYERAKEADETMTRGDNPLEDRVSKSGLLKSAQLQFAPNILQDSDQQSYRQAQRAFTEARLRKESGAAIPNSEYENDAKTYFAQPGDSAATIEQKRKARQTVLNALRNSAGRAYEEAHGGSDSRVPTVGSTFNGEKVLKVTKIP